MKPMIIEWQALSAPARKSHWVHVAAVPAPVMKAATLTGRQCKDDDGTWKPMSLSKTHGKVAR